MFLLVLILLLFGPVLGQGLDSCSAMLRLMFPSIGNSCRYASLYFCMCIDQDDNELEVLEMIHHFVEILDRYFGSVSYFPPFFD